MFVFYFKTIAAAGCDHNLCISGGRQVHEVGWASSEIQVLGLLLAFRLTNSVVVCTYFNADEYWQSLEVAHRLVFGYDPR